MELGLRNSMYMGLTNSAESTGVFLRGDVYFGDGIGSVFVS